MFGIQLSAQAAANCSTGYKTQTNPFSRWAGCDIAQNGNGITTSSSNGEWSAGFDFGDFIAIKGEEKIYYQVTQEMRSEETITRELAPLKEIKDNFPKIVLTLDSNIKLTEDGIRIINLLDFLLS